MRTSQTACSLGNAAARSGDLALLAEGYKRRFAPQLDAALHRYQGMRDLRTAVENAALARRADGKRENHQLRIKGEALHRFEAAIQKIKPKLMLCKNFDELHHWIDGCKLKGVGTLAVYDTAWRIGAFLNLRPDVVYLHAGALQGAKALGLHTRSKRLSAEHFPSELSRLAPVHIENFLCIYKEAIGTACIAPCDVPKRHACW